MGNRNQKSRPFRKSLAVIWSLPNTMLGLGLGIFAMCFGTRVQYRRGCLEFYGGPVTGFLKRVPPGGSSAAMTIGHVILGVDRTALEVVRDHEHVHVRQYEKWGPVFLPVYLGYSGWLWFRKQDPYLDNPFEVQAYLESDPRNKNGRGDQDSGRSG